MYLTGQKVTRHRTSDTIQLYHQSLDKMVWCYVLWSSYIRDIHVDHMSINATSEQPTIHVDRLKTSERTLKSKWQFIPFELVIRKHIPKSTQQHWRLRRVSVLMTSYNMNANKHSVHVSSITWRPAGEWNIIGNIFSDSPLVLYSLTPSLMWRNYGV